MDSRRAYLRYAVVVVSLLLAAANGGGADAQGRSETERPDRPERAASRRVRRAARPIPNEYVVVLARHADGDAVGLESERVLSGRLRKVYRRALKGFSMRMSAAAAEQLARDPRVLLVEEDGIIEVQQSAATWGLDRIDQRLLPRDGIANFGATGAGVAVHVVDTGIRATHQEFGGRATIAGDYVDDDADPATDAENDDANPLEHDGADCHGHGTHVAGTIGGATYGVAKNVTIYAHRVIGCGGSGSISSLLAAIEAITVHPHRPAVANLSVTAEASEAVDAAVRASIAAGVTYVVAAGNYESDAADYSPARVEEAITVGATDSNDKRADFSNFGPLVDLFAPGVSVLSAWRSSDTATKSASGTSMATPHVTGAAALYLETHTTSTPQEVHDALVSAATRNAIPSPGAGSPNRLLYAGAVVDTPPIVDLVAPIGGERVYTGTPFTISWEASDDEGIASFDVLYSTNGGGAYTPIAGCSGLPGDARTCVWSAPGPTSKSGRIKVVAYDTSGAGGMAQSAANVIVLAGTASIKVTTPNSAVTWSIGSTQEIKWTHNLGATALMRVELSRDGGSSFTEVLADAIENTSATAGKLVWTVTGPASSSAMVRVSWLSGPASDVSDTVFQMVGASITITTPNSAADWGYGSQQRVKWTHNLGGSATFDVQLSADGGASFPYTLASGVTGLQAYVTTPVLPAPTTQARLRVVWSNAPPGSSAAGVSAVNLSVSPPFVSVTKPGTGTVWKTGKTVKTTWNSNLGALEQVTIELSTDGGQTYSTMIHAGTPSDGSQTFKADSAWVTSNAKVRITWLANPAVTSVSNGTFVIQ